MFTLADTAFTPEARWTEALNIIMARGFTRNAGLTYRLKWRNPHDIWRDYKVIREANSAAALDNYITRRLSIL